MPEPVVEQIQEIYHQPAVEIAATQDSGLINLGDMVLSGFSQLRVAREQAQDLVIDDAAFHSLGKSEFHREQLLQRLIKGVEIDTYAKIGKAIAGVQFIARSLPEQFGIFDQYGSALPYATGEVPADDPNYFKSRYNDRGIFHMRALETGERLTVRPISDYGVPTVALTEKQVA